MREGSNLVGAGVELLSLVTWGSFFFQAKLPLPIRTIQCVPVVMSCNRDPYLKGKMRKCMFLAQRKQSINASSDNIRKVPPFLGTLYLW